MSHLIKKLTLIVGFSFLAITQSLASHAYPDIDVVGSGVYGWQNNRTLWCNSTTSSSSIALSCSNSTDYGQLMTAGLVGIVSTVIIGPALKKRIIDPLLDRFCSNFGVPRCCRRQSSDDMDIVIDLFKPIPPREYELLFRSLDAALSDEESGWSKYVVVDKHRLVVGYKYVLLNDEEKEKASISLIREYEGLENSKGLLSVNSDIRLDKIRDITEIEKVKQNEVLKKNKAYHSYSKKLVKKEEVKPFGPKSHAKNAKASRKKVAPSSNAKSSKDVAVDDTDLDEQPVDIHLQQFKQTFLSCTSENVGRLVNQALNLHLKPGAELRINSAGWFAYLNPGFTISNLHLYFSQEHDKP